MIGIDEVGRGAWAGPLLVCAVRLYKTIDGLKDSKELSPKNRQALSILIFENADIGYGWISVDEIDDIGLSAALKLASSIAIEEISPKNRELIIIDGTVNFLPNLNVHVIAKADHKIACVSAASIVAKVARDDYMKKIHGCYPHYGFNKHVGYGTKSHALAINKHGLCSLHRYSFKLPSKP